MIEKQMPQEVRGAGPLGEHVFKVVHSIKQSPLDGELPALEGELVRKVESSG
jgi:hypothetical protein